MAQPSGLRVCARAWGAPLTCKHTRGKGDAQHRRPDGHFFGHAEKRHFGARSERLGSTERPGPGSRGALRPPREGGAVGGGPKAPGFIAVSFAVPARGVGLPLGHILGWGV